MTLSSAYTEYSIHRVQHTPSTVYTEYSVYRVQHSPKIHCLLFFSMVTCWPLTVVSASDVPLNTINRHQPTSHDSSEFNSDYNICMVAS
jgi:hypothetical protein